MNLFRPGPATEWRTKVAHGATVGFDPKINKAPDGAKEKIRELFFFRPIRGLFRFVILPTVSPWATFCRASGAFLAAMILFFAVGAAAQTSNTLSDAEIQGRKLAQQLLEQQPATNLVQSGILSIRDAQGTTTNIPVFFRTLVTTGYWQTSYLAGQTNYYGAPYVHLAIIHRNGEPNEYDFDKDKGGVGHIEHLNPVRQLQGNQLMTSFAKSDFWVADLGLEFFHWPAQKILPKTTNLKRGREYTLLESTNPNPSTNGYSRVLSCIDKETGGILEAEAYDTKGELLKVFEPKSFKKVNGQWQLQEMKIRNVQTGSSTRLELDLKK